MASDNNNFDDFPKTQILNLMANFLTLFMQNLEMLSQIAFRTHFDKKDHID